MERKRNRKKFSLKELLHAELDGWDKALLRGTTLVILSIILYASVTKVLSDDMNKKIKHTETNIEESKKKISEVDNYKKLVDARTSEYQTLISRIDEQNEKISNDFSSKNAIPNMLNKIMYIIPTGVQLLSIENTSGKSVVITAQADKYDQLGYFKAALEEEGILVNITTTRGVKTGEMINVTISGDLPY